MKRDGVGLLVSICSLAEQRGSRGSINLISISPDNLNLDHRPSEMQAALEVARQDREMAEQRGGGS